MGIISLVLSRKVLNLSPQLRTICWTPDIFENLLNEADCLNDLGCLQNIERMQTDPEESDSPF